MQHFTFDAGEIFEDIPGDPDNVMMKIPPEVLEITGWKEGDTLTITLDNDTPSIMISKNE